MITEADDQPPAAQLVAVLSYGYWERHLGGERSALGKTVILQERPFTIVVVAPRDSLALNQAYPPISSRITTTTSSVPVAGVAHLFFDGNGNVSGYSAVNARSAWQPRWWPARITSTPTVRPVSRLQMRRETRRILPAWWSARALPR